MMHYRKGENIEQELTKDELPFDDCLSKLPQKDFLWMHVKGGTKVHNVINYAKNALDKGEYRTIVWSGSGGGVVKTVSCAEILKRSYPLHQLTRMDQITIEENWVPQMDGLEPLVAKRKVPSLHILMTLDPIDDSITDVQKPNTTTEYWRGLNGDSQQKTQQRRSGANNNGRSQRQRNQKPKHSSQGPNQEEGAAAPTTDKRERPQKYKSNHNKNRGGAGLQQNEGQLQESSQQSQQQPKDRQERQQESQSQRRPNPKRKQQQPRSPHTANVVETPTSTTNKNTSSTMEPMES